MSEEDDQISVRNIPRHSFNLRTATITKLIQFICDCVQCRNCRAYLAC